MYFQNYVYASEVYENDSCVQSFNIVHHLFFKQKRSTIDSVSAMCAKTFIYFNARLRWEICLFFIISSVVKL